MTKTSPMSQMVIYLATAPKSNSSYRALSAAMEAARAHPAAPVPLHIRNAPTPLMACGQSAPTAKNFVVTATPNAPVPGSRATIDQVIARPAQGFLVFVLAFFAKEWPAACI